MKQPAWTPNDIRCMRRALRLAQRGAGAVEPNPMVGCVIARNGVPVGEGYHRRFGGPHAEINALNACPSGAARGATAYVTLEPCRHFGKTPPCVGALLAAGVSRVIAATRDPNPVSAGGLEELRRAGVEVACGLLEDEARSLLAPFIKLVTESRPWVILKWAQSLDGRIATREGDSRWISDEAARAHAHRVRGRMDGILVGAETALRDDPLLTCRSGRPRRIATRIVLDSRLRLSLTSQLVQTAQVAPTLLFCGPDAPIRRERRLTDAGCRVKRVPHSSKGLSLTGVLNALGAARMTNLLVEGGGATLGRFLDAGLADEAHIYVAPLLLGGERAISALRGDGVATVAEGVRLSGEMRRLGDGWFWRGPLARRLRAGERSKARSKKK